MSSSDTRRELLAVHGPCICVPDLCTGDLDRSDLGDPAQFCRPCAYLDPYWPCFNDQEEPWSHDADAKMDAS